MFWWISSPFGFCHKFMIIDLKLAFTTTYIWVTVFKFTNRGMFGDIILLWRPVWKFDQMIHCVWFHLSGITEISFMASYFYLLTKNLWARSWVLYKSSLIQFAQHCVVDISIIFILQMRKLKKRDITYPKSHTKR